MADGDGGWGGIIRIVIIALVLILLIGGGVWAAFWFLGSEEEEPVAEGGAPASELAPAAASARNTIIKNPVFLPLGSFIVNLADGRRYLKTNLELMLSEESAKAYLEGRIAEVKDLIIAELQVLSTEQLRDPQERTNLKQRLLRSIETILPNKDTDWDDPVPIKKVLITEFYLQ